VGAGGAGFPTHTKLNCKVDYLLINAAECEPFLYTDKHIIKKFPREIIGAVKAVKEIVGAGEARIAIKGVNTAEIDAIQSAIDETAPNEAITIFKLDNYYPAGDEQMIVYDITGRTVPPGGIPLAVGCVVSNVATVLNIADALNDIPVTRKYLTVAGEVKNKSVLNVPIGTSFRACAEACGGTTVPNFKVVAGGPMMGKVFGPDALDTQVVTKTTSGILIIKDGENFIARQTATGMKQMLNRAKSACIQCKFCTELCPRNQIGHRLRPNLIMRHMAFIDMSKDFDAESDPVLKEALICCECGVCETYACPMGLLPRQINIFIKKKLAGKRFEQQTDRPSPTREYKKIEPKRIVTRMGLGSLYDKKTHNYIELNPAVVKIPLRQHIGAPAAPCVSVGSVVKAGDLIGAGIFEKVSANIHASISGEVVSVGDSIEIKGG
jgi:Na+-translocating ferredoxin:NAD+ oxidoreductase RnfC subunit